MTRLNLESLRESVERDKKYIPAADVISQLLDHIERLQARADALYKAARPIADKMAEDEAMGAEFDKDGFIEVSLHKAEFEKFIMVVYDWMRED